MFKVQECSDKANNVWKDASIHTNKKQWACCTFDTMREAEVYAYLWCHNVTIDRARQVAPQMTVDVPLSFRSSATYGEDVVMRIVEIKA